MVRANEFLYFQLEAGVIEARIILDISNGHGRHAFLSFAYIFNYLKCANIYRWHKVGTRKADGGNISDGHPLRSRKVMFKDGAY